MASHEATHVATLRGVLGAKAVKKPSFDFKGTTRHWHSFLRTSKVLEDTPATFFDRLVSWRHGRSFRRRINSDESFGFLDAPEWIRLFRLLHLPPTHVHPLSRWCRSVVQPFARTAFVLDAQPR